MIVSHDISIGLRQILDFFIECFKFAFDFMRSIEFFGTNLLSFTITIFLLGIIFPIIFSLVQSKSVRAAGALNESINKAKSRRSQSDSSSTDLTVVD